MASFGQKAGSALGDFVSGVTDPVFGEQKTEVKTTEPTGGQASTGILIGLSVIVVGGIVALVILYS